jgi:colanic acid/amylovoran biosynthesis glycosyltransferase
MAPGLPAVEGTRAAGLAAPAVALLLARYPVPWPSCALLERHELERAGLPVVVLSLQRAHRSWRAPSLRRGLRFLRARGRACLRVLAELGRDALRHPRLLNTLPQVLRAFELAEQVERLGAAHVHAGEAGAAGLAAYVVHRVSGTPFSVTAGAADARHPSPPTRRVLAAAAFVRCRWEADRAALERGLGGGAWRVIRPGVAADDEAAPTGAAGRIVCVGPLDEHGGHLVLVAACLRLRRRGLSFACDIVGDGPQRVRVEAAIDGAGLQGQVHVRDRVEEAGPRLARAALVVHAGLHEAEARDEVWLPLLQAMAARRAVVAPEVAATREMVEDGVSGVLVPAGDPDALADVMERLLRQPEVARWLGEQARRKVGRDFALARSGRQLVEALRS